MRILIPALTAMLAAATAHSDQDANDATGAPPCEESKTVFQDVSMIGRKDRLASNITDLHREMNEKGWRFVDMEIYVENADIEGAFLTYSRTVPCPGTSRSR